MITVTRERRPGRPGLSQKAKDTVVSNYNCGATQKQLAEQFGVSVSTIQRVIRERRDANEE